MANNRKKLKEIKALEEKIAELTAGWQRTQADFINYKNQAQKEKTDLTYNASAELIFDLLPVLDNFQLAAQHIPKNLESDSWTRGIEQIEKQFEQILNQSGLSKIKSVGEQFNPRLHEAIEGVNSERPEGEIVEEIMAGYQFGNEVIRPAKVKVARGKVSEQKV